MVDGGPPERYELAGLLARGATTEVHRAHDHTLDRPVAVKVFAAHLDPAARHRFDHEARALGRLSHPGLVSVFDIGVVAGRPYLVMQLVDGGSLASRLLSGPLSLADTVQAGALLADALAHAHSRGVVHRDVKPSNILLDRDGTPHLTDFGIALLTGTTRLTSTNEILGTPAYLAPEQVLGAEIGPPADVFALGLVLLECATGEMEYAGGTRLEAALARLHRAPRIPATVPTELASLLRRMTASDPDRRPTAAQCARTLTAIAPTSAIAAVVGTGPAAVGAGGNGRRRAVVVATIAAAVACAGLVFTTLDTPQTHPGPASAGTSDHHPLAQPGRTTSSLPVAPAAVTSPATGHQATGRPTTVDRVTVLPSPPAQVQTAVGKNKGKGKGHGNGGGND